MLAAAACLAASALAAAALWQPSAAAAAGAGAPAATARCHKRAHHRCPAARHRPFEPREGEFSTIAPNVPPTAPLAEPGAWFATAGPIIADAEMLLLFTCQPSGAQTMLTGGISQQRIRISGRNFSSATPVIGQYELFTEATAGTVQVSGSFASSTAATLTARVTGLALAKIFTTEEKWIEAPQTCVAGPTTFHLTWRP